MKYTLILIVACFPLLVLTARSFYDLFTVDEAVHAAAAAKDVSAARQLATDAKTAVDGDEAAAKQLGGADLLDRSPEAIPDASSASLKKAVEAWRLADTAKALTVKVAGLAKPPAGPPPGEELSAERQKWLKQQIDQLGKLAAEDQRKDFRKLPLADELFRRLDRRTETLSEQQLKCVDYLAEKQALSDIVDLILKKDYKGSLAALSQKPLVTTVYPDVAWRREQLRKEIQYREEWVVLNGRKEAGPADRALLKAWDNFFKKHPQPPTYAEQEQHDQLQKRRNELAVVVSLDNLPKSQDFDSLMIDMEVVAGQSGIDVRQLLQMRTSVKQWLLGASGIPELQAPECLTEVELKEAFTKEKIRKIGLFDWQSNTQQWKYWRTRLAKATQTNGEELIQHARFLETPGIPKYVRWANEYNDARQTLESDLSSRDRWDEFARQCERIGGEFAAYRKERIPFKAEPADSVAARADKECREWKLESRAALARQVIDRWDRFGGIFAK